MLLKTARSTIQATGVSVPGWRQPASAPRRLARKRTAHLMPNIASAFLSFEKTTSMQGMMKRKYSTEPSTVAKNLPSVASTGNVEIATSQAISQATEVATTASTSSAFSFAKLHYYKLFEMSPLTFSKVAFTPFAGLQIALEALQVATGAPWWAVLVGSAAVLRIALLPSVIKQIVFSTKMEKLQPQINAVRERIMGEIAAANASGNKGSAGEAYGKMQAEINEVLAKHGMSQFSGLKYAFAQMIPMLFFFVSVNRMSDGESVKADFMTGGLGWFTDLSAADPYYIFPLFAVATMFATFYLNPSTKAPPSWLKYVLVAGGAFTFYFTSAMPAAVHMYWAVTNVFTLVTFALLRIPSVRLKLGIPLGAVDAIKGDYVKLLNSRPKTNITSDPNPTNAGTPNPPGRRKRN